MNDENAKAIEILLTRADLLNDWEVKFLDSISEWLEDNGALSEKQQVKLDHLWERVMG